MSKKEEQKKIAKSLRRLNVLCVDFVNEHKMFTTESFTFENNDYIKLTANSIEYLKSKPN